MFLIYSDEILVGRSALEKGDSPMGVAFGDFTPTPAFEALRAKIAEGSRAQETRVFSGLRICMPDGSPIICAHVGVLEAGDFAAPLGWEVECIGFEDPQYADLFPHHVKDYEDAMSDGP